MKPQAQDQKIYTQLPLLSVVMPVYNAEKFLGEAIDSILKQSEPDFELILVDDGSTDSSLSIMERYQRKDNRIILIPLEKKGVSTARNIAIKVAQGRWIALMDADDIALPERFRLQLNYLYETKADICGTWIELFGRGGSRVQKYPISDVEIKFETLFGIPMAHATIMARAEILKEELYDPNWENAEDYDLLERLVQKNFQMTCVPSVLYRYRQFRKAYSESWQLQQNLSQKIRFRCWNQLPKSIGLSHQDIAEVLKLRGINSESVDMSRVEQVFSSLLAHVGENIELKEQIFRNVKPLYLRGAGNSRGIASRWNRLRHIYGMSPDIITSIELWLVSKLAIKVDSRVFAFLQKIYLSLKR